MPLSTESDAFVEVTSVPSTSAAAAPSAARRSRGSTSPRPTAAPCASGAAARAPPANVVRVSGAALRDRNMTVPLLKAQCELRGLKKGGAKDDRPPHRRGALEEATAAPAASAVGAGWSPRRRRAAGAR